MITRIYVEKPRDFEEQEEFKATNALAKEHLNIIDTEIEKINDLGLEFHYREDAMEAAMAREENRLLTYKNAELLNQRTMLIFAIGGAIIGFIVALCSNFIV